MSVFIRLNPSVLIANLTGFSENLKNVEHSRYSFLGKTFGYHDGFLKLCLDENDYFPNELIPYVLGVTSKFSMPTYPNARENGKYVSDGFGTIEVTQTPNGKNANSSDVFITAKSMHSLKKLREMILSGSITPTVSYKAAQKILVQVQAESAKSDKLEKEKELFLTAAQNLRDIAEELIRSKWFCVEYWSKKLLPYQNLPGWVKEKMNP